MRIIKKKTLDEYLKVNKYKMAKSALEVWYDEVKRVQWNTPHDVQERYGNCSIIGNKRLVFNIKGNDFRLIVDIEYKLKWLFIIWFGTHKEYDNINAKTIKYEN